MSGKTGSLPKPKLSGKKAHDVGTERARRRRADFDVLFRRLAKGAPQLLAPEGAGPILNDLAAAETPIEWNNAVARLIAWALERAAGSDGGQPRPEYSAVVGHLAFLVGRGFIPPARRPANAALAEHDGMILKATGVTTLAGAVAALDEWDRASLLPGQELVDQTPYQLARRKDRLRKRALRAAAHAGIVLETRQKKARSTS